MPGEDIQSWSITALNNGNADSSINWLEGQPRASVNNSARSMMAAHAKARNLTNGSIVTGGTPNAQTFTSGLGYVTTPIGLRVMLKIGPGLTNTAAGPTLNMDGIGAATIFSQISQPVPAGALLENSYNEFLYIGANVYIWLSTVTAPTIAAGDNDQSIATTAFVQAALAAGSIGIRVFNASSTYPVTSSPNKVLVYCKGAGGGGAGATVAGPRGGGGGEGAESWCLTFASTLSGLAVTVGIGGAAGVDGAAGGHSSIGVLAAANGGSGGTRGDNGGSGGAGGVTGFGQYTMAGAPGQSGSDASGTLGFYAAGGGKGGGIVGTSGVANSGGGGGNGSNSSAAGAGGSGIVVCYEYGTI